MVLFVAAMAFFLGSCQKEGLTNYERKILGEWEFDKVTRNGFEINNDFKGDFIQFNSNFSTTYLDDPTGDSYTGVWEMIIDNSGSDDECSRSVFASFTHDVTGEIKQVVLNNVRRSKKRIVANFQEDFRSYRYVLQK
jgi:hypothetical protein